MLSYIISATAELEKSKLVKANLEMEKPTILRSIMTLVIIFISAGFIGYQIYKYANPTGNLYEDPRFYNLTDDNVQWDVFYGHSPSCGELECHLTEGYPASNYLKKMVLPAREFPLNNYKDGDFIFLRTKFKIPERFLIEKQPIVFHSLYIWAKNYQFYLNEKLISEGFAETVNIPLPIETVDENSGEVFISIKINPENLPYQGLSNRLDLLIGKKADLIQTTNISRELKTTYYLWYIVPRLTFCIVFGFIYLFLSQKRELFSFLFYIIFSSLNIFFESGYSDFLSKYLDQAYFAACFRVFTEYIFLMFVHDFFRKPMRPFLKYWAVLGMVFLAFVSTFPFVVSSKSAVNYIDLLGASLKIFVLLYGVYIASKLLVFLKDKVDFIFRKRVTFFLLLFFISALIPATFEEWRLLADLLSLNYSGFSSVWAYDLLFFVILSSVTAMEFGMTAMTKNQIQKELIYIESQLELGRTVQSFLLPQKMKDTFNGFDYEFYFSPAQEMSGDWFADFTLPNDEKVLFVGDVTGKGPPAALAVSSIITILSEYCSKNTNVKVILEGLNSNLFTNYNGNMASSLVCVHMKEDQEVVLYNMGSSGCFYIDEKFAMYPLRSNQVGKESSLKFAKETLDHKSKKGKLFMFTDGVIEGPRALNSIKRASAEYALLDNQLFFQKLITSGKNFVLDDDKTILIIHC